MAHVEQHLFLMYVKQRFPQYFENVKVLDCGSYDYNGKSDHLFKNSEYIGIDIAPGRNVHIVSKIHEFDYPDEYFDTIISAETFEHDMYYEKSLQNICRLLKSGGLFLFTCATTGRPEHGTLRTTGDEKVSLTILFPEWANYYKNLEEKDIRAAIDIDSIFEEYEFQTRKDIGDLYFWGIKRKSYSPRINIIKK